MKRKLIGALLGLPATVALYNLLVFLECICVYHEPFLFGWKNIVFPLIGWAVVCVIAFIFRAYHRRKKQRNSSINLFSQSNDHFLLFAAYPD